MDLLSHQSGHPIVDKKNSLLFIVLEMDTLPFELVIPLLLELHHIPSIVNFSLTCTKYYELVHNNQFLWRILFAQQFNDPHYSYFTPPENDSKPTTDWKSLVHNTYQLYNNWDRGKAVVSYLPGKR